MNITDFMAGIQVIDDGAYTPVKPHKEQRITASKAMILDNLRAGKPLKRICELAISIPGESDPAWAMLCTAELEGYEEPPQLDCFALARNIYNRYHTADLQSRATWGELSDIAAQTRNAPKLAQRLISAVINTLNEEAQEQAAKLREGASA